MMHFLETLSPEQRIAFDEMATSAESAEEEPDGIGPTNRFAPIPLTGQADGGDRFYHVGASVASRTEVKLLAVLLT
eukprot:1092121-Prymnesium_polylepis.1